MKIYEMPPPGIEFVKIKEVTKDGWVCPKCGKVNPHHMSWCNCVYEKTNQHKNKNTKNNNGEVA